MKAYVEDGRIEVSHLKQRLNAANNELQGANEVVVEAKGLAFELQALRVERDEMVERNKYLAEQIRNYQLIDEDLEREIEKVKREGVRREGSLKIAMTQWER